MPKFNCEIPQNCGTLLSTLIGSETKEQKETYEYRRKTAFTCIEEVVDYIKKNGCVLYDGLPVEYNFNSIKMWHHNVDGDESSAPYTSEYMTLDDFAWRYGMGMDEFGFLPKFSKTDKKIKI